MRGSEHAVDPERSVSFERKGSSERVPRRASNEELFCERSSDFAEQAQKASKARWMNANVYIDIWCVWLGPAGVIADWKTRFLSIPIPRRRLNKRDRRLLFSVGETMIESQQFETNEL